MIPDTKAFVAVAGRNGYTNHGIPDGILLDTFALDESNVLVLTDNYGDRLTWLDVVPVVIVPLARYEELTAGKVRLVEEEAGDG